MSKHQFFIAGTDTDVGKTLIATAILHAANQQGLSTLALKPVAAGCEQTGQGLRNSDALLLQQTMSIALPYEQVNPVALQAAIAPHIAAEQEGKRLSLARLVGFCRGALMQPADFALIEGAGGWRVPLNARETMAGLAKELNTPVILVVGMKLGCINHALLTAEAIAHDGVPLAGWVANQLDAEMPCYQENINTLKSLLRAPCLGEVPRLAEPRADLASSYLNIDLVIKR
ncbi:dethiobiotin synthase [Oceanicoccus sp. KOV_DT_Chl]|uniref:dethiobiotin synthase n=1 Tax=Oceanicoccus sp. KOV_DT_Chl TaxID=1904639 RepID=UPI000C79E8F5|nr:dethiobiotin synthase [Oceanicoccus sp. KOV_DT_Chl]